MEESRAQEGCEVNNIRMAAERVGGSFGARTWPGLVAGAVSYCACTFGLLQPSRSLFERSVNSKPAFFDTSFTRRYNLWPLPQRVTSFGWKPLRELWETDGALRAIKGGVWLVINSHLRSFASALLSGLVLT